MQLAKTETYTVEDIYALPNTMHQRILLQMSRKIADHIDAHAGHCEVFPAPFAVFLNKDDRNYVEPDISVICDKDKIDDRGARILDRKSPEKNRHSLRSGKGREDGAVWI